MSTATIMVQPTAERLSNASALQPCPLDQLTSASALPSFPQSSTPSKASHDDGTQDTRLSSENLPLSLLKTALDSFFDSILVIHPNGQILQANSQANDLFANAVPETLKPQSSPFPAASHPSPAAFSVLPKADFQKTDQAITHSLQPLLNEIWRVATAMKDSQIEFPDQDIILDSEVAWDDEAFRIRVRWMDLAMLQQRCLLVTIEDLQQTAKNQANVDRWKYKLTPREGEVWQLKRQGYSYKAIASTLFVSENTVKKHLKNVQAKRRDREGTGL